MAKRFYDTGLVEQSWYQNLKPEKKALYIHLLCVCDIAGVFETNYAMMGAYIGCRVTESDVFESFGNRVIPLANHESKGIMVDFVYFQCGGTLNENVSAHMSISKRLRSLGISIEDLQSWCTHRLEYKPKEGKQGEELFTTEEIKRVSKVVPKKEAPPSGFDIIQGFNLFYDAYPRHDSKQVALLKFGKIMRDCKDDAERAKLLGTMLAAIRASKDSEQWKKEGGKFIPMPSTWLNQKRWEDEGIIPIGETAAKENEGIASEIAKGLRI